MSNAVALEVGSRMARDMIARHVLNKILVPFGKHALQLAVKKRIFEGSNMTGNTINSYAVGIYVKGHLAWIETPSGSIPGPLQRKLGKGQKFYRASRRWDEEFQTGTFKGCVSTNGAKEPERSINFLKSYKAINDGWEVVVCNGVEYASYQESVMNIDVLTESFDDSKFMFPTFINPMPD